VQLIDCPFHKFYHLFVVVTYWHQNDATFWCKFLVHVLLCFQYKILECVSSPLLAVNVALALAVANQLPVFFVFCSLLRYYIYNWLLNENTLKHKVKKVT